MTICLANPLVQESQSQTFLKLWFTDLPTKERFASGKQISKMPVFYSRWSGRSGMRSELVWNFIKCLIRKSGNGKCFFAFNIMLILWSCGRSPALLPTWVDISNFSDKPLSFRMFSHFCNNVFSFTTVWAMTTQGGFRICEKGGGGSGSK